MKFNLNSFIQAFLTVILILGGIFILFGSGPRSPDLVRAPNNGTISREKLSQKVYVAVEGEGKIAVIAPIKNQVIKNINLGGFSPHNIQVSPDNKTVWVTGNATAHSHSLNLIQTTNAHGEEETANNHEGDSDEVIIIDPAKDIIIKRIKIKPGIHLAHVVLTPNSRFAYVTAQTEGIIYKINAMTYEIVGMIKARENSEPHGLRISPDGRFAYVAMLKGKSLGIIDLGTDQISEVLLNGAAVQTGVTPNNKYAVVSLYDTKQLGVYNIANKSLDYIDFPAEARGPIQMYATPDSKFIYIADQGYYFGKPAGEIVYKIDIEKQRVVKGIKAGEAPHGVVISNDGQFVYVTNLLSGDVSVIDTTNDIEIKRIKVGKEPNGISIWRN